MNSLSTTKDRLRGNFIVYKQKNVNDIMIKYVLCFTGVTICVVPSSVPACGCGE